MNSVQPLSDSEAVFAGLEPAGLWKHFARITRIPRPSGREEQVADYVRSWAERRGYSVDSDAAGNMCVRVPGTTGREEAPIVVLQAHLDMVCERDSETSHDAERGDIQAVRDGDWIGADGTTLGADNGIGLAAMLHAAEAADVHGPLDLLFTVDEETGLHGVQSLDPELVRGRMLLNLDHEKEGELCVGCAGSGEATVTMRIRSAAVPPSCQPLVIRVHGLLGGHSGMDIDKPRLNAIRAIARLLSRAASATPLRLVEIQGGSRRNAIPREASAFIVVPAGAEERTLEAITQETETLRAQFARSEHGLTVETQAADQVHALAWSVEDSQRVLDLLLALPCGVLAVNPLFAGLVETSNSVGTAKTGGDEIQIGCLIRSSFAPAINEVLTVIRSSARLAAAEMAGAAGYPGWHPDPESHVVRVSTRAFQRVFCASPRITGVHAGLECGIIGERIPGMDMVSFGPEIIGAHAPGERVHVPSVERFWRLLAAVLEDLSYPG